MTDISWVFEVIIVTIMAINYRFYLLSLTVINYESHKVNKKKW